MCLSLEFTIGCGISLLSCEGLKLRGGNKAVRIALSHTALSHTCTHIHSPKHTQTHKYTTQEVEEAEDGLPPPSGTVSDSSTEPGDHHHSSSLNPQMTLPNTATERGEGAGRRKGRSRSRSAAAAAAAREGAGTEDMLVSLSVLNGALI